MPSPPSNPFAACNHMLPRHNTDRRVRTAPVLGGYVAQSRQHAKIRSINESLCIPKHIVDEGVVTRTQPSLHQRADIKFALPIVRRLVELDIGHTIAVKEREVIAVEAIEGTEAMIRRAGELCQAGKWVLLKMSSLARQWPHTPTVGTQTIIHLKSYGGTCLAVPAGTPMLVDKTQVLAAADGVGICVVGFALERSAHGATQATIR